MRTHGRFHFRDFDSDRKVNDSHGKMRFRLHSTIVIDTACYIAIVYRLHEQNNKKMWYRNVPKRYLNSVEWNK